MAIEKVAYDSSSVSVHGKDLHEAVDLLTRGRAKLNRVHKAMDLASNAGTAPTTLQGGALWC